MSLVLLLLSVILASFPMVFFLGVVWWMDHYEREPIWLVGLTFLWGAVGAIMLSLFNSVLTQTILNTLTAGVTSYLGLSLGSFDSISGVMLIAPLVEEPSKALILLVLLASRHFDNMTDGFVYGAAAGLGFGMTENFFYFAGTIDAPSTWIFTVLIRTLFSATMHAACTAMVGAALGFARYRDSKLLITCGLFGLVLAMSSHGLWNGLLSLGEAFTPAHMGGAVLILGILDIILLVSQFCILFFIFGSCLVSESVTIRTYLTQEANRGQLPKTHPAILSSWIRRSKDDWLSPGVSKTAYVKAATLLAMRLQQKQLYAPRIHPLLEEEIVGFRRQVNQLLSKAQNSA